VLIPGAPVISVEASGVRGWKHYAHAHCGIENTFGLSAPADKVYAHFLLTKNAIVDDAKKVVTFYTAAGSVYPVAPSILDYPQLTKRGKSAHIAEAVAEKMGAEHH
jgi:hypothetical protein